MKRHVNSLLQRRRADFDGPQNPRKKAVRGHQALVSEEVMVKDGYDWLREIRSPQHRQVVQSAR